MGKWYSKMPKLVDTVERYTKKRPTQVEISEATGIRQPTISEWMQQGAEFKRLDGKVVSALLNYFNQFFPCRLDDLVDFDNDTQEIEAVDPSPEPAGV